MDSLNNYLVNLSDRLDKNGKHICADAVDEMIKTASLQKVAQYVGVIGYVLKQNRAMGNCVRKKRVASNAPMQEVVLECLKEYQDSQDYHNTEWSTKYAQVLTQEPGRLGDAHLYLLNAIGEHCQITTHIERLQKTADTLNEHQSSDPLIEDLLKYVASLGEILQEDVNNSRPFKLAAPRRSRWSRFWTPSQFSWYNPMSWSRSNLERGQDEELLHGLDLISEHLASIEYMIYQANQADRVNREQYENEIHKQSAELRQIIKDIQKNSAIHDLGDDPPASAFLDAFSQSLYMLDQAPSNRNVFYDYVKKTYTQLRSLIWSVGASPEIQRSRKTQLDAINQNISNWTPPEATTSAPSQTPSESPQSNVEQIEAAAQLIREKTPASISNELLKQIMTFIALSMGSEAEESKVLAIADKINSNPITGGVSTTKSEPAGMVPRSTQPPSAAATSATTTTPSSQPSIANLTTSPVVDPAKFRRPSGGTKQTTSTTVYDLIRIADALDLVDPLWSEPIDQFIKKQKDIVVTLPELPSISAIVQEDEI